MDYISRQNKIRNTLNGLSDNIIVQSTLKMFPRELKRFRKEFPNLVFNILSTGISLNSKMYLVLVSHKKD